MERLPTEQPWLIARPRYAIELASLGGDDETEKLSFDYTVYQITRGQLTIMLDDAPVTIAAPGFAFIQPGRAYRLAARQPAEALCLHLKSELIIELANQIGMDWHGSEIFFLQQVVTDIPPLRTLCEIVLAETPSQQAGRQLVLDAVITQIVVTLLRGWLGVRRNPHLELSRVGVVDRRLRRALEFIHANYHQELALAEIAQAAFLSEYHFAHLFKRIMGLTPHNYLAAVRVEQAKRMIAETDLSIATISSAVGYASQSHFTKIFRTLTGITPARYRERLQRI